MNPHYYSLAVSGLLPTSITSPDAKNAIADWQEAHGLVADGVIGPATADAMHLDGVARGVKLHFADAEILQGMAVPDGWAPRLRATMRMGEVLRRDVFGGVPVQVLSGGGFRDPNTPRQPGQAKRSMHYELRALDTRPAVKGTGTPMSDWRARVKQMMTDGRLVPGGFKVYLDDGFLHCDSRGYVVDGW